nr:hypothetical protein [uncultured Pedobacter sp.]
MKNSYKILLGGILLFGIITWSTLSLSYDADGADQYGFPLKFYTKVSGYNLATQQGGTSTDFDFLALLADVAFAFAGSYIVFKLIKNFNRNANI